MECLTLTPAMLGRLHDCWDAVAAARASQSRDLVTEALAHLASFVDAQNAFWLGSVRVAAARPGDPLNGWRPRAIKYLYASTIDTTFARRATRECEAGVVDESTINNARQAGAFRARLLSELVSPSWYESAFYELAYTARNIRDAVFVIAPVNEDAESFFGFHRKGDKPPFTTGDRDLLAHALRGLHWVHREVMLHEGLSVARTPLTPAERRVLDLLLTERTEKEIAASLGLAPRTAHHHVTQILGKFGVKSRAALMALWLGRR
jgi:DNA-binding CsgD family transcriptional regulator